MRPIIVLATVKWRDVQKSKEENNKRDDNVRLVTSFSGYSSQVRIGENRDYKQNFQIGQ